MVGGGILTYENCVSSRKRKRFRFPVALHSVVETVDTLIFHTGVRTVYMIIDGEYAHKRMEEMLESGEIQGAVTMHYPFPIGVSTIGRVVTPGRGREMFLAATTGTLSLIHI